MMHIFWPLIHLSFAVGALLAMVAGAHMIRQQRSPSSTIAWLLVIVIMPYIGVPLYLMLSGRKAKQRASRKGVLKIAQQEAAPLDQTGRADSLLRAYSLPAATVGNRVELCVNGEIGYQRLVELIESATRSIDLATFVFHLDEVGREILGRLSRKAEAGVDVRLLVDAVGTLPVTRHGYHPLVEAGGHVAMFMPLVHFHGHSNLRNHRKILVVDGVRVIAGGTNIGNEYIGPTPMAGRWRDLSFVLEGPGAATYAAIFDSDWRFANGDGAPPKTERPVRTGVGDAVVQVTPAGPDVETDALYDVILSSIFDAQRRVWIVTPYFVPDDALAQSLAIAARRGVDVRVLTPRKSNHLMANLASGTYLREAQSAGVKVLLYPEGMVHAKAMIVDDELAMIGSANMDMRSLFLNYEVSMFVYSRREIDLTVAWYEDLAGYCEQGIDDVGPVRDLVEGIARIVAPLL